MDKLDYSVYLHVCGDPSYEGFIWPQDHEANLGWSQKYTLS